MTEQLGAPAHQIPDCLHRGAVVWLTGLPSSGKSTLAIGVRDRLAAAGLVVNLLDGDAVRANASRDLGFSRQDRIENVRRIGVMAAMLADDGGVVLCPVIAPYRSSRQQVRLLNPGRFFEVFVSTPLAVCQARDVKGLYARQRAGLLTGLTGVDDPYEPPEQPELTLSTDGPVAASIDRLWAALMHWKPAVEPTSPE